jgi:hypothetical protein
MPSLPRVWPHEMRYRGSAGDTLWIAFVAPARAAALFMAINPFQVGPAMAIAAFADDRIKTPRRLFSSGSTHTASSFLHCCPCCW